MVDEVEFNCTHCGGYFAAPPAESDLCPECGSRAIPTGE